MHRAKEHPKVAPSVVFSFFEHKTPYKKQDKTHVMFFWRITFDLWMSKG